MEKIEYYFNTNKYKCWECVENFKSKVKYYDIKECPLCHVKIEKETDISINFEKTSREERNEIFNIIYQSDDVIRYGFDKLDGELLIEWFHNLTPKKRKEIYSIFTDEKISRINSFINEYWQWDRAILWRETFNKLSKKKQIDIIEDNFKYYEKTKEVLDDKYDWSEFSCILEKKQEYSQMFQIKNNWCDLGMQVYDCKINSDGGMCDCLRHASDTTAYKCFKNYLEGKGLKPDGVVPMRMKYQDA